MIKWEITSHRVTSKTMVKVVVSEWKEDIFIQEKPSFLNNDIEKRCRDIQGV